MKGENGFSLLGAQQGSAKVEYTKVLINRVSWYTILSLMLARKKNKKEISKFLFWERKRIGTLGQIIYPSLIISHFNIPFKGEITHSTEYRVKLAVTNFLEAFFLSIKLLRYLKDLFLTIYVIPNTWGRYLTIERIAESPIPTD